MIARAHVRCCRVLLAAVCLRRVGGVPGAQEEQERRGRPEEGYMRGFVVASQCVRVCCMCVCLLFVAFRYLYFYINLVVLLQFL